jgi:hypothetical protein
MEVKRIALHAGLLGALLTGLLRGSPDARATETCVDLEPDVAPSTSPASLPLGLVYRRTFAADVPLDGPGVTSSGLVASTDRAEPGAGLAIVAEPGGVLQMSTPLAEALPEASRLRLVVTTEAPLRLEVEVQGDRGPRLWRPVELDAGTHTLDVRFTDLRYDRGVAARVDDATRWGVRLPRGGAFELAAVELWRDDHGTSSDREIDALREDFDDPSRVVEHRRGSFVLLTDATELDPSLVLDALERTEHNARRLLPRMPTTPSPVPLLVFADAAEYRRFWSRFGARHGAEVGPRSEDEGLTWQGVATAVWSDQWPVRPTFTHEAHHALLERSYRLSASRSWLFEGLAILEQLEISRQDLRPVYRKGLRRRQAAAYLEDLTDGAPIDTGQYWQAAMFVGWLTSDPGRLAALDAALVEMSARGDTNLNPVVPRYFGTDFRRLSVDFWSWAWLAYGP